MKNNMYVVIKNCIEHGKFKVGEIIPRIREEVWSGQITDAQRDELIELAHKNANPNNEAPEIMEIVAKLIKRMDEMEQIIHEHILPEQSEDSIDPESPADPVGPAYEYWKPWDGISSNYKEGTVVSHGGKLWISAYNGQNVWEPGIPGVDERYWIEYIESTEL